MKVIHVLGLAHGGTTITDRLLACHPHVIGLGETSKALERNEHSSERRGRCSCGRAVLECPIWAPVMSHRHESAGAFYADLFESARSQGASSISETSKSIKPLTRSIALRRSGAVDDVFALRLVRDPRAWVHSALRKLDPEASLESEIVLLFWRWLASSLRLDSWAASDRLTAGYLSYDRLVLERGERGLAGLIGLDPLPAGGADLGEANQHALAGNQFLKTDRRAELVYDTSWQEHGLIAEVYADLPIVERYFQFVQTLHFRRVRLSNAPGEPAMRAVLSGAKAAGDPSLIIAALDGFDPAAEDA